MPTFEYHCEQCRRNVEILVRDREKFSDQVFCKECNQPMKKLLFPSGIIFKGSGFYHTDYGKGSEIRKKEAKEASKPAAEKSESKK